MTLVLRVEYGIISVCKERGIGSRGTGQVRSFTMTYRVYNHHGISQCGCEVINFDNFDDLQDYCMEHENDMNDGYITIEEVY